MLPIILFGGVFTNVDTYPAWIRWLQYLSPIRYGLEALVYNEFEDNPPESPLENPIDSLNFKMGFVLCISILFVLTVVLRVISMIALRLLVSKF